jgi:hypothetical protein
MAQPLIGKIMNVKINLIKPQVALKTVASNKKESSTPSMAKGQSQADANKSTGHY